MKTYRNFRYEVFGVNHYQIENLFATNEVRKLGDEYPLGIRIVSIPEAYKKNPVLYVKRIIDQLYEQYQYHTHFEVRYGNNFLDKYK